MGSGQAVRRLPLEQEIEGSNPSSPANVLKLKDPVGLFLIQYKDE